MSNTMMANGKHDPLEILEGTKLEFLQNFWWRPS